MIDESIIHDCIAVGCRLPARIGKFTCAAHVEDTIDAMAAHILKLESDLATARADENAASDYRDQIDTVLGFDVSKNTLEEAKRVARDLAAAREQARTAEAALDAAKAVDSWRSTRINRALSLLSQFNVRENADRLQRAEFLLTEAIDPAKAPALASPPTPTQDAQPSGTKFTAVVPGTPGVYRPEWLEALLGPLDAPEPPLPDVHFTPEELAAIASDDGDAQPEPTPAKQDRSGMEEREMVVSWLEKEARRVWDSYAPSGRTSEGNAVMAAARAIECGDHAQPEPAPGADKTSGGDTPTLGPTEPVANRNGASAPVPSRRSDGPKRPAPISPPPDAKAAPERIRIRHFGTLGLQVVGSAESHDARDLNYVRVDLHAAAIARAERAEVQLAGCGVAALGWNQDPAKPGDYGWSASYGDVLKLRTRAEALEKALRDLVESLPRCKWHPERPATRAFARGGERYCDECGFIKRHAWDGTRAPDQEVPEYPRAQPLRNAVALLDPARTGPEKSTGRT